MQRLLLAAMILCGSPFVILAENMHLPIFISALIHVIAAGPVHVYAVHTAFAMPPDWEPIHILSAVRACLHALPHLRHWCKLWIDVKQG